MWVHWGSEQQEELRYQVTCNTYLASGGQLLYALSVEQYVKLRFFVLNFLAICQLHHSHIRKDTRLSLLFHTASNEKRGGAWE